MHIETQRRSVSENIAWIIEKNIEKNIEFVQFILYKLITY